MSCAYNRWRKVVTKSLLDQLAFDTGTETAAAISRAGRHRGNTLFFHAVTSIVIQRSRPKMTKGSFDNSSSSLLIVKPSQELNTYLHLSQH